MIKTLIYILFFSNSLSAQVDTSRVEIVNYSTNSTIPNKTVRDTCILENSDPAYYCKVCYYSSSNLIKSRHTRYRYQNRKWAIRETYISWDENGKFLSKSKSKSKLGGDFINVYRSVIIEWTFWKDGKRVLYRKKNKALNHAG